MSRRIAVVGTSGSGKTTLARRLARRLGLPHVELDALHHGPGWTEASAKELQHSVGASLERHAEGWVVDGNYSSKIGNLVLGQADMVVWLDLPLSVILWRLLRRTSGRIARRTELWNGNRETIRNAFFSRDSLFAWAVKTHPIHRRDWPPRFDALEATVVRLRSPREVERWLLREPEGVVREPARAESVPGSG